MVLACAMSFFLVIFNSRSAPKHLLHHCSRDFSILTASRHADVFISLYIQLILLMIKPWMSIKRLRARGASDAKGWLGLHL